MTSHKLLGVIWTYTKCCCWQLCTHFSHTDRHMHENTQGHTLENTQTWAHTLYSLSHKLSQSLFYFYQKSLAGVKSFPADFQLRISVTLWCLYIIYGPGKGQECCITAQHLGPTNCCSPKSGYIVEEEIYCTQKIISRTLNFVLFYFLQNVEIVDCNRAMVQLLEPTGRNPRQRKTSTVIFLHSSPWARHLTFKLQQRRDVPSPLAVVSVPGVREKVCNCMTLAWRKTSILCCLFSDR